MVIFITADENTNQFFSRFAKIKIKDPRDNKEKTWRVAGVNPYYGDGIIVHSIGHSASHGLRRIRRIHGRRRQSGQDRPSSQGSEERTALSDPSECGKADQI